MSVTVKVEIKTNSKETEEEYTIFSINLEQENENNYEKLIPEHIQNTTILGGDSNSADTKMKLQAKVYHFQNIREIIQTINIQIKKSHHQILIFQKEIKILIINTIE